MSIRPTTGVIVDRSTISAIINILVRAGVNVRAGVFSVVSVVDIKRNTA